MPPTDSPLLLPLRTHGFLILPALLPPASLPPLLSAANRTTSRARAGHWPHIRTVGKQFPPWPPTPGDSGIWGVQHLLHPDLPPEDAAAFAAAYFGDAITAPARELLGCSDGELVMELCNLLVRPGADFALRWHRDDIPADATPAEEEAALGVSGEGEPARWHTQWNLALEDDASLILVPGSHRRARTAAERAAGPEDELPGQVVVRLRAGDAAFYDNNILHRGVYDGGVERYTLHGSVGRAGGSRARARNVLQHGVGEWVGRCDFGALRLGEGERVRAEGMRERLVAMGRESGEVGYSLEG